MATATGDNWARDPRADENPDLTRKRQRLSEDTETSPLSSNGSPRVEGVELPANERGTSIHNAIQLHDDPMAIKLPSEAFTLDDEFTAGPAEQLQGLLNQLLGEQHIEPRHFLPLASWLREHLEETNDESLVAWREMYTGDSEFFHLLARFSINFLAHGWEVFRRIPNSLYDRLGQSVVCFIHDIAALSTRIVLTLPQMMDAISRRDSGLVNSRQPVHFLLYTTILAQVTTLQGADFRYFKETFRYRALPAAKEHRRLLLQDTSAVSTLAKLLRRLGESPSEIVDAWDAIDAILRILGDFCVDEGMDAIKEVEQALATIHHHLLPAVHQMSPRALPAEFHEILIKTACRMLSFLAKMATVDQSAALYSEFIKNDSDALLTESAEVPVTACLTTLSNDSPETLVGLLRTAWNLQALKTYIFSSIMDVRSSGISQLSKLLLQLYNSLKTSQEGFEHPILRYVGRFMRSNELTKYIFGPESHASLISHSQHIIGFLAATFLYTDTETDLIWAACTTSVEAEFVKASFGVLTELCRYLDLDHLLYLVNKYAITPPDKLGKDAVETLTDLFQKVQLKSGGSPDQDRRLRTAFISIEIIYKVDTAEQSPSTAELRDTARAELIRFTTDPYSADDRAQIYKRCVPNILKPDDLTTTSIEILLLFLDSSIVCHREPHDLLSMLSVGALVDEFSHYIEAHRDDGQQCISAVISAIQSRIDAIIRLQALPGTTKNESTLVTLSDYAIGKLAISNEARDCAWRMLSTMDTFADVVGATASVMLHHCLEAAISLPLESVTPTLLAVYGRILRRRSEERDLKNDYCLILQTPIWQKLVQTAESTAYPETSRLARDLLCDALFQYPARYTDKSKVSKCHADFAKDQISHIRRDYQVLLQSASASETQTLVQRIDLLAEVFRRSKLSAQVFESTSVVDIVLAREPATEVFQCKLQVYGGAQAQPKLYRLHIRPSTTLSELGRELPKHTGAASHRVVIGGHALHLEVQGDRQISQLGIGSETEAPGVISICPKYTIQSDIEILLTSAGEVEKELLVQYDELETLLDGPEEIAHKTFTFITQIRLPALTRIRIAAAESSTQELFPIERKWRSAFTVHVLKTNLELYTRIGVADEAFLCRGVALLVGLLLDDSRQIEPIVFKRAMACLVAFLQERPLSSSTDTLIESPTAFVSRILDICYFFLRDPTDILQQSMVVLGYQTLLEAFRRQCSVWHIFKKHARVIDLHERVFLQNDTLLVIEVASMVKNFCMDASSADDVTDFFLRTGLAIIPRVLEQRAPGKQLFALVTDSLLASKSLRGDEAQVREICQSLTVSLQNYEHSESVDLPLVDLTMAGLLRLLKEGLIVVRSFKKPLAMNDLAVSIFKRLLFPPLKDNNSRPLIDNDSRQLAYNLVGLTCESRTDFSELVAVSFLPMYDTPDHSLAPFPGRPQWLRPAWQCSGLTNLGMTCYMNSLLQQLFANVQFRKFIFEVPVTDDSKQELLCQVQWLFARMQNNYDAVTETGDLAKVLNIKVESQEDVHGFYEDFLGKLESNMPDEHSRIAFNQFFTGTLISQIKGECGHVSPKTEPFVDLQIIVKNKVTLQDSLQEFVQGEPMEGTNRYKCLLCDSTKEGRLVNAMRRSCPEKLPDNLTFCLKRFSFESMWGLESKVNDRFEFPEKIAMARWTRAQLEDPSNSIDEDVFELVGVIVHQGSLQMGHYWSYTLLRNTGDPNARSWVKLEDRMASPCRGGIGEVQGECFGGLRNDGNERTDNAYVLFYQRRSCLEEQIALPGPVHDPATSAPLPSKVTVPTDLQESIRVNNNWRYRIANLFDDDFHAYVMWLLGRYNQFSTASPPQSDYDAPKNGAVAPSLADHQSVQIVAELSKLTSKVATTYLQRVVICDSAAVARLEQCVAPLKRLIAAQPDFASGLLGQIASDHDWLYGVTLHSNSKICAIVEDLVLFCLTSMREQNEAFYRDAFARVLSAHSSVKDKVDATHFGWESYLDFAGKMSQLGIWETALVLDHGYFTWAVEVMYTPATPRGQKLPGLVAHMRKSPLKVSALFEFVTLILGGNVVVPGPDDTLADSEPHYFTDASVVLKPAEFSMLIESVNDQMFLMTCAKFAWSDCKWEHFAPGKLMALLMSLPTPYRQNLEDYVTMSLELLVKSETTHLTPILHLMQHFCANIADENATRPFQSLARSIHDWENLDFMEFLDVVRMAHKSTPLTVVSSIEHWCLRHLMSKMSVVRQATEQWLRKDVFGPDPVSGDPILDARRVRQTRKLVRLCIHKANSAYKRGESRINFESTLNTVLAAEKYLEELQMAGKVRSQSSDEAMRASISAPLSIELDELSPLLKEIDKIHRLMDSWKVYEPLQGSRMSAEPESEYTDEESEAFEDDETESTVAR